MNRYEFNAVRVTTRALMLLGSLLMTTDIVIGQDAQVARPASEVNPFIGPGQGPGGSENLFPGAALPFGMVQLSPDTEGHGYGYHYDQNTIQGFSMTHMSGVGCPNEGDVFFAATAGPVHARVGDFESAYSHSQESAAPGYYQVVLSRWNVNAELSATDRTGVARFTYPAGTAANILVPISRTLNRTMGAEVRVVGDREHLRHNMITLKMRQGDLLTTDERVQEEFGVSRATARKAIDELVDEGLVERITGKGTFVTEPRLQVPLPAMLSFTEEIARRGMSPSTRIVSVGWVPASERPAQTLGVEAGANVLRLERIRYADARPILQTVDVPPERLGIGSGEDFSGSLYELMELRGIRLAECQNLIEAAVTDRRLSNLLQVRKGFPILALQRTSYDTKGPPVLYEEAACRGDMYSYAIRLARISKSVVKGAGTTREPRETPRSWIFSEPIRQKAGPRERRSALLRSSYPARRLQIDWRSRSGWGNCVF